jgi:glycolate oxidase iron-sulfur subunit
MSLTEHYDEIARCNRCGFCQVACPIFRATGHEAGVARGRVALLRALVEERIDWTSELKEPLFACLLCGACTANCFPKVATADLITTARQEYLESVGRSTAHRLLFSKLLPSPERLRLAAKTVALGQKSRLPKLAGALGLLRIFGRDFPKSLDILDGLPLRSLRERIPPSRLAGRGTSATIAYFVGCGPDIVVPEAAESTLGLLRTLAASVQVLPNVCCGLPAKSYGDLQAARHLAEKNLDIFSRFEFDLLVTDCSSCAAFLKSYPELFRPGDPAYSQARHLAERVRDILELLPEERTAAPPAATPRAVTYHDPCHAVRGQGLAKEPRRLLDGLPGLEYRELPEADWCCGGPGSYAMAHYDLSRSVLERKIANIEKTGAEVVYTSCPACLIQLRYGLKLFALPIRAEHISQATGAAAAPAEPM